jgi:hypothetical protein
LNALRHIDERGLGDDRGGDERREMTNPASGAAYLDADEEITREVLARRDELNPCPEHWKILIAAGMGFFADACDLFIIGAAATLITADGISRTSRSRSCRLWLCSPRPPERSCSAASPTS